MQALNDPVCMYQCCCDKNITNQRCTDIKCTRDHIWCVWVTRFKRFVGVCVMADITIKGSLLVTPWDNAEKGLHLQCVMEPLWPDDLLDTRRVMSCLTYHTRTHCVNHKHCLLSLQQSHLSISVMSSVHHLCFWLWQEHVVCSHFMCFPWYNYT